LYVERDDWPEAEYLAAWMHRHGRCAAVTQAQAEAGDFGGVLAGLLRQGRFPPLPMTGVEQAAELLADVLGNVPR
jgi:hypothetical protein